MNNKRLIARLDVKGTNLVKGIQFEGLRKLGNPNDFALKYYAQGIDEIIYIDIVASLYDRNNLSDIVYNATSNVFIPITVGGGIRNLKDADILLHSGADKIAINTAALKEPELITKIADRYGSQCMVLSVQAKRQGDHWEAYYDNGREHTGRDAVEWAVEGFNRGAGEILISSVDRDGTMTGFDIDLVRNISDKVTVPVIAGGGMSCEQDFVDVINSGHVDAVAAASVLHYEKTTVAKIKEYGRDAGIDVR